MGSFPGNLPVAESQHLASVDPTADVRPAIEGRGTRCTEAECEHCHPNDVDETRFADETRLRVPKAENRKLVIAASRDMGRTAPSHKPYKVCADLHPPGTSWNAVTLEEALTDGFVSRG